MNLVVLTLMTLGQAYCEAPASVTYYSGVHPDQVGVTYYHETPTVYAEVPLLWSQPNSAAVPVSNGYQGFQAVESARWYYCPIHNRYTQWQRVATGDGQVAYRVGGTMLGPSIGVSTPYMASPPVQYVEAAPVGRQMQRYGLFGRRVITRTVTPAPRLRTYAPTYAYPHTYASPSTTWGGYTSQGNCIGGYCN